MSCAICRFGCPPTDRVPYGPGVAHVVCVLSKMLKPMKRRNRR